jgi:hypothetical protein
MYSEVINTKFHEYLHMFACYKTLINHACEYERFTCFYFHILFFAHITSEFDALGRVDDTISCRKFKLLTVTAS